MARSDWTALLTDPAAEYIAHTELQRFGLDTYLPQVKKRHHTRAGKYVMRSFPLFPRYLLLPVGDAHDPAIHLARGISKARQLLADEDGRPHRIPGKVIDAVREAERRGIYDEILHKGDNITMAYGVLSTVRSVIASDATTGMIELLMPLFNGCRATINAAQVVRA